MGGGADGAKLWKRTDLAGTASLAYADGAIYAHTSAAMLYKLNAADGSTIWGGDPMPPGSKLSDAQIQQVRMWVKNGARDD